MPKNKPKPHPETWLVAVTGESPAVVTESVYGLYFDKQITLDRILIITTTRGAAQAENQLLLGEDGKPGPLEQLCLDYNLPRIPFSKKDILVVPGENGEPVDDARSLGDQRALADFITQKVRELTRLSNVRLVASLAGGRKTMTFFLGYAMSLFGRPGDLLTHVLVSDPYEHVRNFYYPTPQPKKLEHRHTKEDYDSAKAKVTLVDIPFVRMREEMPANIIQDDHGYTQTVDNLNRSLTGKRSAVLNRYTLSLELEGQRIYLSASEYAFYAMFARSVIKGTSPNPLFAKPKPDDEVYDLIIAYLDELLAPNQREKIEEWSVTELVDGVNERLEDMDYLKEAGKKRQMPKLHDEIANQLKDWYFTNFSQLLTRVKREIIKALGTTLGELYVPQLEPNPVTGKRRPNSIYRLELDPVCIQFIE